MKPAGQILIGVAAAVALMVLNGAVEYAGNHPTVGALTLTTVALAAVARLLFTTARPR